MAMALEPYFFTPPPAPRHLAELRIEPALSAVAFSAPCAADAERKRRCLLPASSVRKRMLLELPPFDPAPGTPPPPPTPPPSPMASRAAGPSFAPVLRPIHPTATAGNMFAFGESAPTTPGGSEASSAANMFAFLAAPERPDTPTGPTPRGGFLFAAASSERPLTPTSKGSNTSGLSFLASLKQPSLMPTGMLSPAKETKLPPVGLATPSFVFSASRSPPPPPRSGSKKRRRPNLRIETAPRRMSPRQWEEDTPTPPPTPPPQKPGKSGSSGNGEPSRSSIISGPCCLFVTSPAKAAKQEANTACSEASRSQAGSRCTSPARPSSPEKPSKPEQEVEVSSRTCSGAEVVVRITCKCGVHKEFSFDHRP
ncbi:unnamed protein product [Urochloa humidicola]